MSADEKITVEDLLDAMREADVLEVFVQLPPADQDKFAVWIGKARDEESHWRRINALMLALRTGPLYPGTPAGPISSAGGLG